MASTDQNGDLREAAQTAVAASFGAVMKLAPEGGEAVWVDGRAEPPAVAATPPKGAEADCVWRGGRESLIRALSGERAMESAFVAGRIAISGDMSVMARIALEPPR